MDPALDARQSPIKPDISRDQACLSGLVCVAGTRFANNDTGMQPSLRNSPDERKTQTSMTIADTLKVHPLCEQIVHFLLENEHALDTARGIAAWWVRSDEIAVQAALDRLIGCGVIALYPFTSGVLYGLTRDQDTRARLRKAREAKGRHGGPRTPIGDMPLLPDHS
jgi:hypothetical protein